MAKLIGAQFRKVRKSRTLISSTFELDAGGLDDQIKDFYGGLLRTIRNKAIRILRQEIAKAAPSQTGDLKNMILGLRTLERGRGRAGVFLASFASGRNTILRFQLITGKTTRKILWVDRGTGIHGTNRRRIRPKNAEILRFVTESGDVVFAKSVAGQPGQRFIAKGVARAEPKILRLLKQG